MAAAREIPKGQSEQIAHYLSKHLKVDMFREMLDLMDGNLIPPSDADTNDGATRRRLVSATLGLANLLTVLGAFGEASYPVVSESLQSFMADCWGLLIERWDAITHWMCYLSLHPETSDSRERPALRLSVQTLATILINRNGGPYKEEIVTSLSTAATILHFLCLIDPETQTYATYQDTHSCPISGIYHLYAQNRTSRAALAGQMSSLSHAEKAKVVAAFTGRARELVTSPASRQLVTAAAVQSFYELLSGTSALGKGAAKMVMCRSFLAGFSRVLSTFANQLIEHNPRERTVWLQITESIETLVKAATLRAGKNPTELIPFIVEQGIVQSGFLCLKKSPSAASDTIGAKRALEHLLPYFTVAKVYFASVKSRDRQFLKDLVCSASVVPLRDAYINALTQGKLAFDTEKPGSEVNMCSNLQHRTSYRQDLESLQMCSGCHSVFYCSKTCQGQDWVYLHSEECKGAAVVYNVYKSGNCWGSPRAVRDQVAFLQAIVNRVGLQVNNVSTIMVFDLTGAYASIQPQDIDVAISQQRDRLWANRAMKLVIDMRRDPKRIRVVKGIFRYNCVGTCSIYAKFLYEPFEPNAGRRYRMINNVFSINVVGDAFDNACGRFPESLWKTWGDMLGLNVA